MTIPTDNSPSDLPETERTVSSDRFCNTCDAHLTARRPQARFCSDRCRVQYHRGQLAKRRNELLNGIVNAVHELLEIGGCNA
jgi:hypothetical protein